MLSQSIMGPAGMCFGMTEETNLYITLVNNRRHGFCKDYE
jgi:hypothetical protein